MAVFVDAEPEFVGRVLSLPIISRSGELCIALRSSMTSINMIILMYISVIYSPLQIGRSFIGMDDSKKGRCSG